VITKKNLDAIERFADKLWAKVGLDVEFTRHFLDRVNDARNKKQITGGEIQRLFRQSYKRHGKKIANLGKGAEAVIKDMETDINMPFVLQLDKNGELDLVAKTVMRKKDFKTSNKTFAVEDGFKKYVEILEATKAGKNVHMTHIEDRVIYGGVKGAREAIFALRSLRDMLAGNSKTSTNVTVKWDGAPAVFAGIDPSDGQFFVAKKGIFNKNPKVYKSEADVRADTSGDLADKLSIAFNELKDLGIKGVIQGDIMFTKGDVEKESIDGEAYYTFQPNTIVYAVPVKSELGKTISKANLGVVWHTTYTGKDFESMKASFGVKLGGLKKKPSVWYQDAEYRDMSGTATFSDKDTKEVTSALSRAGKIFQKIQGTTLRELEKNTELSARIETFNNTLVRRGERITNTTKHVSDMLKYFDEKFEKEKGKRSSAKGKAAIDAKKKELLKFFSPSNKKNLVLMFDLMNAIVEAKLIIINKLDRVKQIDTFVRTKNGFKVTGSEGFVAIDKSKGGAVKLVDRLEFSMNNFSSDVIKGWEK
jgi:hypothetical protein